jgi:hypothetical protein
MAATITQSILPEHYPIRKHYLQSCTPATNKKKNDFMCDEKIEDLYVSPGNKRAKIESNGSNGYLLDNESVLFQNQDIVLYPQTLPLTAFFRDELIDNDILNEFKLHEKKTYGISKEALLFHQKRIAWDKSAVHKILFDWVREVCADCHFYRATFHQIVRLINLVFCKYTLAGDHEIQLLATTCIWIVAKAEESNTYYERYPNGELMRNAHGSGEATKLHMCAHSLATFTDKACDGNQIIETEPKILKAVGWRTLDKTSFDWLNMFISWGN